MTVYKQCQNFVTFAFMASHTMNIASNIKCFSAKLPPGVNLVAVSKNHLANEVLEAYEAGHRMFGENKAQELVQKAAQLPPDIDWHFIGHLQTNKVRLIVPYVHTIQSVESLKLLEEINREALRSGKFIRCLLEFHIAREESKFGLDIEEAKAIIHSPEFAGMKNICIAGVMGMATYTENTQVIREEFRLLHGYFEQLRQQEFEGEPSFREISMGMSGDYPIAIEEGSTMVRIGTAIFGERQYNKIA
jgi:PLP dependent protein